MIYFLFIFYNSSVLLLVYLNRLDREYIIKNLNVRKSNTGTTRTNSTIEGNQSALIS